MPRQNSKHWTPKMVQNAEKAYDMKFKNCTFRLLMITFLIPICLGAGLFMIQYITENPNGYPVLFYTGFAELFLYMSCIFTSMYFSGKNKIIKTYLLDTESLESMSIYEYVQNNRSYMRPDHFDMVLLILGVFLHPGLWWTIVFILYST